MKTFTADTLPVTVAILSRWIDYTDKKNPRFKFMLQLDYDGRQMLTEYSGGIMAFITPEDKKKFSRESFLYPRYLPEIIKGKQYIYDPIDKGHESPAKALTFLLNRAQIKSSDVCYSLVMDTRAGELSFRDFCDEFGYEDDRISSLDIHRACEKLSRDFRALVRGDFAAIEKALEDY